MAVRDPDDKKRRLLNAALAEFAQNGIGSARVDQIAKRAGVSAGLVYPYFGGKEGLFLAVYDQIVASVSESIPLTPEDLGEYAGKLYDAGIQAPEVMRFVGWYSLERGSANVPESVATSMEQKTAQIAQAQAQGLVSQSMTAGQILATVLTLANMWQQPGEGMLELVPESARRQTVVDAVRAVVDV